MIPNTVAQAASVMFIGGAVVGGITLLAWNEKKTFLYYSVLGVSALHMLPTIIILWIVLFTG